LRDRIERAKEASKSTDSEYSPWNTDPAAMWLKTGIVDASRFWPLSPEMAQAVQWDEQADRGERQTVETPQGEAELTSPPEATEGERDDLLDQIAELPDGDGEQPQEASTVEQTYADVATREQFMEIDSERRRTNTPMTKILARHNLTDSADLSEAQAAESIAWLKSIADAPRGAADTKGKKSTQTINPDQSKIVF